MTLTLATMPTDDFLHQLKSAIKQDDPNGSNDILVQILKDRLADRDINRNSISIADKQELVEGLIQSKPSLQAIYMLDLLGIVSIQTFFHKFRVLHPGDFESYLPHLSDCFMSQLGKEDTSFLARTWSALLNICFGQSDMTSKALADRKKTCFCVLDHLLLNLLRRGKHEAFSMTNECNTIDEEIARQCSMHCLDIFTRDDGDRLESERESFKTVVELLVPLEAKEVARMVSKLTDMRHSQRINEANMKMVIKVLINCFEEGEKLLKSEVESRLVSSLLEWDENAFRSSLQLVRTLCSCIRYRRLAPGKSFYGEWFSSAFGQEQTSIATKANRKYQVFLQMLCRMVPEEEGIFLTAHLSNRPYLPPAHSQAWKDYMVIARSKVADLSGGIAGGKLKRKRKCDFE